ncbi:hypothetical protein C8Q69DRAFT_448331 [Paecilomyces variotii]|uniref:Uncharacterized protein n=1 Tax=Byssochlamys spectabilis TaxID=264951 RepID=A0A443HIF6_BYSSP|nr:hypothetical protein C8Q69DRAFT_448331 [Paecilomyces variotii]RWQ91623.1 hypothetical protein C8Q69DRAFT_448331 [Paecilomyces variotii]
MKFLAMMIALAASTASVMAAPLSTEDAPLSTEENKVEARSCPNGWSQCGVCNGTSCKIAGLNCALYRVEAEMENHVEGVSSKQSIALASNIKGGMASAHQISFVFLIFAR